MRQRGPTVPLAGTAGEAGQLRAQPPRTPTHVWLLHLPGTRGVGHGTRSPGIPAAPAPGRTRILGSSSRTSSLVRLPPQLQLRVGRAEATAALSSLAPSFCHPKALPGAAEGLPVSLGGPCGPCSHRAVPRMCSEG